jgi:threonyl-tRNA synthetase
VCPYNCHGYPEAIPQLGEHWPLDGWIDNGFYYDFDMEPLTYKDLKKIKKGDGESPLLPVSMHESNF